MTSLYDATGLTIDRYADILARFIELAEEWKGSSLSTDEEELLGHLFRQEALVNATANEIIQAIFDTLGVSNNSGVPLDNMLELIGLVRQSEAKSIVTLTCVASKACTIPAGKRARTDANTYWETDEDLVFAGAGSDTVTATCTVYGPVEATAGEIDTIATPVDGWTSVTNVAAAIPGRNRELDSEIKARHTLAVATSGDRDAASLYEAVTGVDGVSSARVTEDYESITPVHVYVIGGTDADVAGAIDSQITAGIGTNGTTSVVVYNTTTKTEKTIRFTRATNLSIYVEMTLDIVDAEYPATGDNDIKAAIIELFETLRIGQDVEYLQLPRAIYETPGHSVVSLYMGTAPSPSGTSNISVDTDKRAVVTTATITINHV